MEAHTECSGLLGLTYGVLHIYKKSNFTFIKQKTCTILNAKDVKVRGE